MTSRALLPRAGMIVGSGLALFGIWLVLPTRSRVVREARAELGKTVWEKYLQGTSDISPAYSVSWCGLYSLWVLHQAGLGKDIKWSWGKGFLFNLPKTTDPKPGDIAYIDQPYQHHAIVERVKGNVVHTIDGNSPGAPGGIVARRARYKDAFSSFYSIKPLLPLRF